MMFIIALESRCRDGDVCVGEKLGWHQNKAVHDSETLMALREDKYLFSELHYDQNCSLASQGRSMNKNCLHN